MKKSRFSEEQIICVLKEHRRGFRRGSCDARRLKSLEDENLRLKKLLAESMLDVAALKECWKSSNVQDKEALRGLGDRKRSATRSGVPAG